MISQVRTSRGVDYSTGRPNLAAVRAAGYRFVGRYVGLGGDAKQLTGPELDGLVANGLRVLAFAEGSAGWMLGGKAAGQNAYHRCRRAAEALEVSWPQPVYLAADVDVQPDQVGHVWACLAGYAGLAGLDGTGLYGPGWLVERALDEGRCRYGMVSAGWRHGWRHAAAQCVQRLQVPLGGEMVDPIDAYAADIGLWGGQPAAPKRRERDMVIIARHGDLNTFKTDGVYRYPTTNAEIPALREIGYDYRVVDPDTWGQLAKLPTRSMPVAQLVGSDDVDPD